MSARCELVGKSIQVDAIIFDDRYCTADLGEICVEVGCERVVIVQHEKHGVSNWCADMKPPIRPPVRRGFGRQSSSVVALGTPDMKPHAAV